MAGITRAIFTQFRVAARRKTLLLLWWIDGGRMVVERSTLARDAATRVWAYVLSNLLTLSMVAMGLLL